ncbi:MAG: amidohydrolase family protein [Deltaproteobacteria bacterium]|nr:amidohydrolase family protein [Deltaproteobacteria bacterium]
MATQTPTIDSQVHAYERDRPERPWSRFLQGPAEVTGDDMVAAMDAVGVDGALLVSPFMLYRYDASYALEVYAKHPGRFGLIKPFDPRSAAVAEEIAEWARTPGVVGARLMLTPRSGAADDAGLNRILAAGATAGIPVNVLGWGQLALVGDLARRHPNTQVVVDHVGLLQPFAPPVPPDPFAELATVVSLAAYDNVAIKISGACTLSHQPFP